MALFAIFFAGSTLLGTCRGREAESPPEILVSAAADLQFAFEEVGAAFEDNTGIHPVFNFGSSGQLARQISTGAPADVFASANTQYVNDLQRGGLIVADTNRAYARGRITVWVRPDSPLQLREVRDLAKEDIRRIAIADPTHAPYGMAAREALIASGVWDYVEPRLVYGETISDTLRFAQVGDVDAAIVALSLSVRTDGRYFTVPAELHTPINQAIGVVRSSPHQAEARAFVEFVVSDKGQSILRKYGFELPAPQ